MEFAYNSEYKKVNFSDLEVNPHFLFISRYQLSMSIKMSKLQMKAEIVDVPSNSKIPKDNSITEDMLSNIQMMI